MASEPMTLRTTHADASTLRGADDSSSNPATPFIKEEDPGTPSLRPLRTAQHEEYSVSSPTTTFDDVDRSIDDRFSELNSRSPTHFLDSPACPLATHRPPEPTPPSYSAAEVVRPPDFVGRTSNEALPRYAEEAQTEPKTLARGLWRWGWVCPLLWAIGMTILWIPLKPIEEEPDPEKAQKMDEMIAILRITELEYARRCLWAFLAWMLVLAVVLVIAIVVTKT